MICPNCKNSIAEGTKTCPFCNMNQQNDNQINIQSEYKNNDFNNKKIVVLICAVVLIFIIVFFSTLFLKKDSTSSKKSDDSSFFMKVEDYFTMTNRGTVVTGVVERGTITKGDKVEIVDLNNNKTIATVESIEILDQISNYAKKGETAALLLENVYNIEKGYIIQSNVDYNYTKNETTIEAKIYMYTVEEGGRQTPFFNDYKPEFKFNELEVIGTITILNNINQVNPGDTVNVSVKFGEELSISKGSKFIIREGGREIAKGTVEKIK